MDSFNSRFARMKGNRQKQSNTDQQAPREEERHSVNNVNPWEKLAFNMGHANSDMIRKQAKICPQCRSKMEYISLGEYRCPQCHHVLLDDYGKIRAFIDEHGPSTAIEIEEGTGVPRAIADDYLKKGRLEIVSGPAGYLRCEICGEDIRYGRICPKCARTDGAKMKGYFVDDVGENPYGTKDAGAMRFKKKRQDRLDSGFKIGGKK